MARTSRPQTNTTTPSLPPPSSPSPPHSSPPSLAPQKKHRSYRIPFFRRRRSNTSPDEQEQPQPQQPHPFSFKKLLRGLRLVILLLAFATLILDAITISFEVNVMSLELSDVSTQAGLLLAPDILAMVMILVLLIYPIIKKSNKPEDVYVEEPYDYSDEEYYDYEEEDEEGTSAGEQIRHGNNNRIRDAAELQSQMAALRRIEQALALDVGDSTTRHQPPQRQYQPRQGRVSPVAEGPENENDSLEQDDEKAEANQTTVTAAAAAAAATTAPETAPPSISPSLAKRRRIRKLYAYITVRIIVSFGLTALALYWPASNLRPPMGYLPGLDTLHHRRPTPAHLLPTATQTAPFPTQTASHLAQRDDSNVNQTFHGGGGNYGRYGNNHGGNNNTDGPGNGGGNGYGGDGGPGNGGGGHHGNYGNRWCSLEEAFGDNQSAIVYCQVKTVRPAMTYVWAILVIVELCIAYMAGDFSTKTEESESEQSEQQPQQAEDDQQHSERQEYVEDMDEEGHTRFHMHSQDRIPSQHELQQDEEAAAGGIGDVSPSRSSTRRQRSEGSSRRGRTVH